MHDPLLRSRTLYGKHYIFHHTELVKDICNLVGTPNPHGGSAMFGQVCNLLSKQKDLT